MCFMNLGFEALACFGGDFQTWISVQFFFSELDVSDVHVETWDSPGSM